ncbi:MAG: DUF5606 domain-containing protein [Bacteroidales bacterium]|jgi:hypothetical protein|nr:DUF5606 domain-containing protein [Bacteroidales bacterium]
MDLTKILAVSGRPGLYKMISQSPRGIVAEALTDGKKVTIFTHERISALEEISIFTVESDAPLKQVFRNIFEKLEGKQAISHKSSSSELRKFMKEALPDYDQDRVYNSDIQKLVNWYNLLVDKNLLDLEPDEAPEEDKPEEAVEEKSVKSEVKAEKKTEKKPKPAPQKKSEAKKTSAPVTAKPAQRKTSPKTK